MHCSRGPEYRNGEEKEEEEEGREWGERERVRTSGNKCCGDTDAKESDSTQPREDCHPDCPNTALSSRGLWANT